MPRVVREQKVREYSVVILQRLPGEAFDTEYAVRTQQDGKSVWLFSGCFGYGDDLDGYVTRKFDSVVEDLTHLSR